MVFNGHREDYVDSLDEELFADIQVMYADGMLGNKAIFDALTPVTTALFNYMRPSGASAYRSSQIFPWINEYSENPDQVPTDTVSQSLLAFISQAPGFSMERFKNGNG